jgi:hypothetical protein
MTPLNYLTGPILYRGKLLIPVGEKWTRPIKFYLPTRKPINFTVVVT